MPATNRRRKIFLVKPLGHLLRVRFGPFSEESFILRFKMSRQVKITGERTGLKPGTVVILDDKIAEELIATGSAISYPPATLEGATDPEKGLPHDHRG